MFKFLLMDLLGQDIHSLTQQSGQYEPEGVHGGEGLCLLLLPDLCLGPDGPDRVTGAGEYCFVERVRPGNKEQLLRGYSGGK